MASVIVILAACLIGPGTPAEELLGPSAVGIPVGPTPNGIGIADFDRDGAPDLAVATGDDGGSISVLRGDGRGGFSPSVRVRVGDAPEGLLVADFDEDGAPDVAVTNLAGNSVSILLGDGRGGLTPADELSSVGAAPIALAAADFDTDGTLDLAVVNRDDNSLRLLLGDGQGGFQSSPAIAGIGPLPIAIAAADFDADARPDLAVVNFQGDDVTILLGDGRGGFAAPVEVAVGRQPLAAAPGDFDGDGWVDLAVANGLSSTVSLLFGDGSGAFAAPVSIGTGVEPISLAAVDLDTDGVLDLAVANRGGNSVSVLDGNGDGTFTRRCVTADPAVGLCLETQIPRPRDIAAADLDGDGAVDLALTNNPLGAVTVLLGDGLGDVGGRLVVRVGTNPEAVAAGDFDEDGVDDVAVAETRDDSLALLLSDGKGGFAAPTRLLAIGDDPAAIAVADLDGDGDADIATANVRSDDVSILLGDGTGGVSLGMRVDVRDAPSTIVAADFDRDGDQDLAVVNSELFSIQGNSVSILRGQGDGTFSRDFEVTIRNGPGSAAVGEFNGDGIPDLAVTSLNQDELRILLGDGDGNFQPRLPDLPTGDRPRGVGAGDFDGDGDQEIVVVNENDDNLSLYVGQGDGSFAFAANFPVGDAPSDLTVADLNSDGNDDVTVVNSAGDSLSALLGDGQNGFLLTPTTGVGDQPLALTLGDFDADGSADVAVANRLENSVSILFNGTEARADTNGSNRVDGFDVAIIQRLAGKRLSDADYRRSADVDLNGEIGGEDLSLAASRFGELNREVSPLRATLVGAMPPVPDSVTFRQTAGEGDLLVVRVVVLDEDDPVTAADFAVTFEPDDGDPKPVLEFVNFEPGDYMAGVVGQLYGVDRRTPDRINVGVSRLPIEDRAGAGEQTLFTLLLRPRRPGTARLDFAAFRRGAPVMLNTADAVVPGITFSGGLTVDVDDSAGGPPGQKIGFSPAELDFGDVAVGASAARRKLRLSNFGFSELRVQDVEPSLGEFSSFFRSEVGLSPFGFVELAVEFTPVEPGLFAGDLLVRSDDPARAEVHVPVVGRSGSALGITPARLEFDRVAVGSAKILQLTVVNRSGEIVQLAPPQLAAPFEVFGAFDELAPLERGTIDVRFTPNDTTEFRGDLDLRFTGGMNPRVVVRLVGRGI